MSQTSGHADNHKTEGISFPSSQWGSCVSATVELIESNLLEIKTKVAPCKPRIIGVTKYYGANAIVNGYKAGIRDFAESRAIDAIKKIESLPEEVKINSNFHFIGHLQTNKADKVVKFFDYIHSVDSLKLAKTISDAACQLNKRERILLQVNLANEEQKFGYTINELRADFEEITKLAGVQIVGLMCMAPFNANEEELTTLFKSLRELKIKLEGEFNVELPELSMGMSNDYEIATKEGATMIRIGRKLFK